MNIVGKKVYLRAMEYEDMELFREMVNNPEMERKVVGWSFPIAKEQQLDWYKHSIQSSSNLRLSIVNKKDDLLLGMLNLVNIEWKNGTAYHGIKLSDSTPKKQGFGTDSVMALMRYAFEELRLHRIETCWFSDNIASQRLYLKCGWKVEGRSREAIYCNGIHHDLVTSGILKSDYYAVKEELGY